MKKIIAGAVAVACAASMFAVDFAARNYMSGSIAGGDKDSAYIWKLNASDQKDADALVLSVAGETAGAAMQFWYKYDGISNNSGTAGTHDQESWGDPQEVFGIRGSSNQVLRVRSVSVWFKPIDMLKITVGDVSTKLFGETLHYWKDPAGTAWDQYYNGYSGYGTVEAPGINIDVTPIDGLLVTAGIAPGTDKNFVSFVKDADASVLAYGAGVKYDLNGVAGIPLAVGIEFRSAGTKAEKVLGIGASYGNRYGEGFYGMVEGRLRMNEGNSEKLDGITINNHFRFAAGAFSAQLRAPVTIRTAGTKEDPSWLAYSAEVAYGLNSFTPYFLFGNDLDNKYAYKLSEDFGKSFALILKPGVRFNVGAASFDIAAKFDIAPKYDGDTNAFAWSLPFELSLAF